MPINLVKTFAQAMRCITPRSRWFLCADIKEKHECWPWIGYRSKYGHAQMTVDGRTASAHRFAYELFIGKIPPGLHIDHLCRNPGCVNPFHLEAVPQRINTLRGNGKTARQARQTHCIRGHPLSGSNLRTVVDKRGSVHRSCKTCDRDYHWNISRKMGRPIYGKRGPRKV